MNNLLFNTDFACNAYSDIDVLSALKQQPEKVMTIQNGMSVNEISDVVSDKIIAVIVEQFQATKEKFESKKIE